MKLVDSLDHQPVALSFGTSGLRGLLADMTDLECYINIRGFLDFLKTEDNLKPGETVYLAGDLRDSTPHIMEVAGYAITEAGLKVINSGKIPTPAVAYHALINEAPCIMVTGSHIPADRNGIKFYKRGGEVLKQDEPAINKAVTAVRQSVYDQPADKSPFGPNGQLKAELTQLPVDKAAEQQYLDRYLNFFDRQSFAGKQIIVYQHSAVGRDLLVTIFESLGAEVVPVGRMDTFLPIDTENVTDEDKQRFKSFSQAYPKAFAVISTDGDSDRPFVIDEHGEFHRGDVLGVVVANYLDAKSAAVPISSNDAVDTVCWQQSIKLSHTKIGSPYVIDAMEQAAAKPSVSWEVNGGFLLGDDITKNGKLLRALPTRDAALPIICCLLAAIEANCTVAELFAKLPKRYTGGALIDDVPSAQIDHFRSASGDQGAMQRLANLVFDDSDLGMVKQVDLTDGLRLRFESNEVIHLRPSGNAPQFRVYTNADQQARADELAAEAVAPEGYILKLLANLDKL